MQDVADTQSVLEQAQSAKASTSKGGNKNSASTHYPHGSGLKMSCVKQDIVCQPLTYFENSQDYPDNGVELMVCSAQMDHSGAVGWTFEGTRAVTASGTRASGTGTINPTTGQMTYSLKLSTHLSGAAGSFLEAEKSMSPEGIVTYAFPISLSEISNYDGLQPWATSCVTYVPGPNTQ
ncbi:MAG: hypothetical protein QGI45_17180 [Myxococcota bacterium]|nr:hypothetical protein [Myxococcota bacterium]